MAFRVERIHGLNSLCIVGDDGPAGHLYPPMSFGDEWEIWPLASGERTIPGIPDDELFRSFRTKADALAFLGIQPEALAA